MRPLGKMYEFAGNLEKPEDFAAGASRMPPPATGIVPDWPDSSQENIYFWNYAVLPLNLLMSCSFAAPPGNIVGQFCFP